MKKRLFIISLIIIFLQGCSVLEIRSPVTPTINLLLPNTTNKYTITSSPPKLFQRTSTPNARHTSLPTINPSLIPPELIQAGKYSSITPEEAVYLFNLLQKSAKDRDPYLLLEYFHLPIHEPQRCPGDLITTSEDFVKRFPELMNESTRTKILSLKLSDIALGMDGMALAVNSRFDIWFVASCDSSSCESKRIILTSFLGFVTYWDYWETIGGNEVPRPTINPSIVKFGIYSATPYYISMDGYHDLDEILLEWLKYSITITTSNISMGPYPGNTQINSCQYTEMEICPILDEDYVIGEYSIGRLHFICPESYINYEVYLLPNNQLSINIGPYRDLKYLIFKLVEDKK
jgi:hypothetical protein